MDLYSAADILEAKRKKEAADQVEADDKQLGQFLQEGTNALAAIQKKVDPFIERVRSSELLTESEETACKTLFECVARWTRNCHRFQVLSTSVGLLLLRLEELAEKLVHWFPETAWAKAYVDERQTAAPEVRSSILQIGDKHDELYRSRARLGSCVTNNKRIQKSIVTIKKKICKKSDELVQACNEVQRIRQDKARLKKEQDSRFIIRSTHEDVNEAEVDEDGLRKDIARLSQQLSEKFSQQRDLEFSRTGFASGVLLYIVDAKLGSEDFVRTSGQMIYDDHPLDADPIVLLLLRSRYHPDAYLVNNTSLKRRTLFVDPKTTNKTRKKRKASRNQNYPDKRIKEERG